MILRRCGWLLHMQCIHRLRVRHTQSWAGSHSGQPKTPSGEKKIQQNLMCILAAAYIQLAIQLKSIQWINDFIRLFKFSPFDLDWNSAGNALYESDMMDHFARVVIVVQRVFSRTRLMISMTMMVMMMVSSTRVCVRICDASRVGDLK